MVLPFEVILKPTFNTLNTKPSRRYVKRLALMAGVLGPVDGPRFLKLDERYRPFTPDGLSGRERNDYHILKEKALGRLQPKRRK